MAHDKTYWTNLYNAGNCQYGLEPRSFLATCCNRLKKGKVLDLGMGEGQNAVFLAQKGHQVTGIDYCEQANTKTKQLSSQVGISVEVLNQDLDYYLFSVMEFQTVLMSFYKPASRMYEDIRKTLKPGGLFICQGYLAEQLPATQEGHELLLEECYRSNELLGYLKGFRVLYYEEGTFDGAKEVRAIAQKISDKDIARHVDPKATSKKLNVFEKQAEALFKKKKD